MQFTNPYHWLQSTQPDYRNEYYQTRRARLASYSLVPPITATPAVPEIDSLLAPLCAGIVGGIDLGASYLDPTPDPVARLFGERSHMDKARIQSVLDDMHCRYDIMQEHLHALDYEICRLDTRLMELPHLRLGAHKEIDKIKATLETRVLDLQLEKMRERVSAWRDISGVKSDLLEALGEYTAARGSNAFLAADGSGLP
jgi:chorismate mutase